MGPGVRLLGAAAVTLSFAACAPRFDLREVRDTAGSFIVALPGKPQSVGREIVLPLEGRPRVEMTMLSTGVGASLFAVGAAQLPPDVLSDPSKLQQTLAWFRDGLTRNVGAAPVTAPDVVAAPAGLGNRRLLAAQSFAGSGLAGGRLARLAARLYVVDDRLYQLVVVSAEGEVPLQVQETFFDSFRLAAR